MNYTELAEQSVYAFLEIVRTTDRSGLDNRTKLNNSLVRTYPNSSNVNKIDPLNYTITNLPPLILTLPINSIFSYILYIDPDSPDYRFVHVTKEPTEQKDEIQPLSVELRPLFSPETLNGTTTLNSQEPVFKNVTI